MLIIVQPWFVAIGHPAQSLLNTAKIIGYSKDIKYLVSHEAKNSVLSEVINDLKNYGEVIGYGVKSQSLSEGTFKAVLQLKRLCSKKPSVDKVFFFDADLILLSIVWGIFFPHKSSPQLSAIYLHGPEAIQSCRFYAFILKRFLLRANVTIFFRTKELLDAWKKCYPNANFACLPSMEIPADEVIASIDQQKSSRLRFGILGQVREGKGIEWMVPLFEENEELGDLTVAGTFASDEQRKNLRFLNQYKGFINKYLTEQELLQQAALQDYLLMLYDKWDTRLEGAVMYLAARVNKPVIVYNEGWCGRMVTTYNNGLAISKGDSNFLEFVQSLPKPSTEEYKVLLRGVEAFKSHHTGRKVRDAFLKAIVNS